MAIGRESFAYGSEICNFRGRAGSQAAVLRATIH